MRISSFNSRVFTLCISAAMLAGCGGLHPTTVPSAAYTSQITQSALRATSILNRETFLSTRVHRHCAEAKGTFDSETVGFRVRGIASGPISGTFTAHGFVNETTNQGGTSYKFRESFDITHGSQHLLGIASGGNSFSVTCDHDGPNHSSFNVTGANYKTKHERSHGTTSSTLNGLGNSSFSESFQ